MKKALLTILTIMMAVATLSLAATLPIAAQAAGCLAPNEIQAAIDAGQIQSWPKIRRLAGVPKAVKEVGELTVCMRDGLPYYNVKVISPDGVLTQLVLNAVDGSP